MAHVRVHSKHIAGALAFVGPVLALCAIFAAVGIWPLGGNVPLTGDMGGIYMPVISSLRRALLSGEGVLYSLSKSLGGEMLSSYAAYGDLLFLPLYLLVPTANLPDMLTFTYLLKMGLTGWFCWLWLAHRPGASHWWALAAGCAYALCAYHMAYLQNTMWLTTAMLAPLVLACIERFAALRWRVAYCALLALAIFGNFYTGYMLCLFCSLYFLFDWLANRHAKAFRAGLVHLARFAGYSLLAAGLCAALILPAVGTAGAAKGGLFSLDVSLGRNFSLLQLPGLLLAGNFRHGYLSGWLPLVYCGQLVMLGAVLYFFNRGISRRAKLLACGVLSVFLVSFLFVLPNLIWHGFKSPVWFSFRYSFLCVLFLCMLASDTLSRRDGIPRWACAAVGGAWLLAVGYAGLRTEISPLRVALTGIVALAAAVALAVRKAGWLRAVALLAAMELLCNGLWIQNEMEFKDRALYREQAQAVEALLAGTENGYRTENEWFYTLNDPLLYGFAGFSYFNSLQDDETLRTLQAFGFLDEGSTLHGTGAGSMSSASRLLGLRYRLTRAGDTPLPANYAEVARHRGYTLYEDTGALPMVFAAQPGACGLVLGEDAVQNINAAYTALSGLDMPVLAEAGSYGLLLDNLAVASFDEQAGVTRYTVEDPAAAAGVLLEYTMPADGALCLTMRCLDRTAVTVAVNDEEIGEYGVAGAGGLLDLGTFAAGERVVIRLSVSAGESTQTTPVLYLQDAAALAAHLAALEAGRPMALSVGGNIVQATVHAGEGGVLFTSIPYEDGWHATVNGEKTGVFAVGESLLAVELQAGENNVILRYRPAMLGLGIGLTVASLVVLCAIVVYGYIRRKKRIARAG